VSVCVYARSYSACLYYIRVAYYKCRGNGRIIYNDQYINFNQTPPRVMSTTVVVGGARRAARLVVVVVVVPIIRVTYPGSGTRRSWGHTWS